MVLYEKDLRSIGESMSLDWVTRYIEILDQLEADLGALQDGGVDVFKAVYVGRKAVPRTFPAVFIFPLSITGPAASVATSAFFMPFEIRVVAKMPTAREALVDVIERLGLVEQMLIADRQFHELTENLEVNPIEPESIRPRVRDRHEGSLIVTFRKII